jgi:predicted dehydrogenase
LIGYGLAGESFHAPLIAANPALSLEVIVTRDADRRTRASRLYPRAHLLDTADGVWDRARDLDLAVIATPNRTHALLARQALEAGLGVVVDKPFAATPDDARAVIAEAEKRQLFLSVYQNRRWDGDFLTLRRLTSEGLLGSVYRFESRFERWRPKPKGGWRERSDPSEAGGLLYDLGSHLVDQALLLFGSATTVYAELDCRRGGVETDDDVFVALTHAAGVRSHLMVSAVAGQSGPRFQLLGSRAAYVKCGLDVQEDALRRGERPDRPGWGEEPAEQWGSLGAADDLRRVRTEPGAYPAFYQGVVEAIRDNAPPPVDPNDAVRTLEVIAAAQRSAAEGRVISIVR